MGRKARVPVIIEGVMHFICSKCQQLIPIELMMKDSRCTYKVSSHCKACHSLSVIKSRIKNFNHYAKYNTNYMANYMANKRANDPITRFKDYIRSLLNGAIQCNRIIKPNNCSNPNCNSIENIEAHHPEYSFEKALDVIWLCNKCHDALHKSLLEQPTVIFPIDFIEE